MLTCAFSFSKSRALKRKFDFLKEKVESISESREYEDDSNCKRIILKFYSSPSELVPDGDSALVEKVHVQRTGMYSN